VRWLALLALAACGPEAALFVTVEAPLRVPDQCDAVQIGADERGTELFNQTFMLSAQFPQTLTLESTAREMVGGDVVVTATAMKGGAQATSWASASATATLESGKLTPVTVRICDGACTP
jgi:hypothetical protein